VHDALHDTTIAVLSIGLASFALWLHGAEMATLQMF
jgi:hypothetical protein